ncbi:MAG: DNA repair protein RadA, partial [Ktedonobacterales bacterium]
ISPETVLIGEIGLGGELRAVTRAETRLREAAKLGFKRCIAPKSGLMLRSEGSSTSGAGIELVQVGTLAEALAVAME